MRQPSLGAVIWSMVLQHKYALGCGFACVRWVVLKAHDAFIYQKSSGKSPYGGGGSHIFFVLCSPGPCFAVCKAISNPIASLMSFGKCKVYEW